MTRSQDALQAIDFLSSMEFVYRLKSLPRSGWIQSGISETQVESIAGHSFGMSMLILNLRTILHENGINVERALKMALVHDVAEAIVGDLTPLDVVSDHEKHIAEKEAFGQIVGDVPEGSFLSELWDEFEAGQTAEAQIVKRMDKLDMLIQAYFYEKQNFIRLDSFWENMDELFKDTESQSIYDYIRLNRYTF